MFEMPTDPGWAETEAEKLLDTVWADITERSIPVDPIRIANQLGVDVAEAQLETNVAGAIVKERGADATILLNRYDHPNRQRFTCAHELGHYVRHSGDPHEYEFVDYRDQLSTMGTDPEERFANAFAAALLMPARALKEAINSGVDQIGLAYMFRVSQEAMNYRLENLGFLENLG